MASGGIQMAPPTCGLPPGPLHPCLSTGARAPRFAGAPKICRMNTKRVVKHLALCVSHIVS